MSSYLFVQFFTNDRSIARTATSINEDYIVIKDYVLDEILGIAPSAPKVDVDEDEKNTRQIKKAKEFGGEGLYIKVHED